MSDRTWRILAKAIQSGCLVPAGNRAKRRARRLGGCLALEDGASTPFRWNRRAAALLQAIDHQPILTDIEEPAGSPAVPVIRQALRDVSLETIVLRESEHLLIGFQQVAIGGEVIRSQRPKLAIAFVENSHRARQPEHPRPLCDGARVLRVRTGPPKT
jgi:hypothetical protein